MKCKFCSNGFRKLYFSKHLQRCKEKFQNKSLSEENKQNKKSTVMKNKRRLDLKKDVCPPMKIRKIENKIESVHGKLSQQNKVETPTSDINRRITRTQSQILTKDDKYFFNTNISSAVYYVSPSKNFFSRRLKENIDPTHNISMKLTNLTIEKAPNSNVICDSGSSLKEHIDLNQGKNVPSINISLKQNYDRSSRSNNISNRKVNSTYGLIDQSKPYIFKVPTDFETENIQGATNENKKSVMCNNYRNKNNSSIETFMCNSQFKENGPITRRQCRMHPIISRSDSSENTSIKEDCYERSVLNTDSMGSSLNCKSPQTLTNHNSNSLGDGPVTRIRYRQSFTQTVSNSLGNSHKVSECPQKLLNTKIKDSIEMITDKNIGSCSDDLLNPIPLNDNDQNIGLKEVGPVTRRHHKEYFKHIAGNSNGTLCSPDAISATSVNSERSRGQISQSIKHPGSGGQTEESVSVTIDFSKQSINEATENSRKKLSSNISNSINIGQQFQDSVESYTSVLNSTNELDSFASPISPDKSDHTIDHTCNNQTESTVKESLLKTSPRKLPDHIAIQNKETESCSIQNQCGDELRVNIVDIKNNEFDVPYKSNNDLQNATDYDPMISNVINEIMEEINFDVVYQEIIDSYPKNNEPNCRLEACQTINIPNSQQSLEKTLISDLEIHKLHFKNDHNYIKTSDYKCANKDPNDESVDLNNQELQIICLSESDEAVDEFSNIEKAFHNQHSTSSDVGQNEERTNTVHGKDSMLKDISHTDTSNRDFQLVDGDYSDVDLDLVDEDDNNISRTAETGKKDDTSTSKEAKFTKENDKTTSSTTTAKEKRTSSNRKSIITERKTYNMEFICVECNAHLSSNQELNTHISIHQLYGESKATTSLFVNIAEIELSDDCSQPNSFSASESQTPNSQSTASTKPATDDHSQKGVENICLECDKECRTVFQLQSHRRSHNREKSRLKGPPFSCLTCGLADRFDSLQSLAVHKVTNCQPLHKEDDANQILKGLFGCNICGRSFRNRLQLTNHKKEHINFQFPSKH